MPHLNFWCIITTPLEELNEIWKCRQEETYRHQVGSIDPRATNHHWNRSWEQVGNTAVGVKDKCIIFFRFGKLKNQLIKICPRKLFGTHFYCYSNPMSKFDESSYEVLSLINFLISEIIVWLHHFRLPLPPSKSSQMLILLIWIKDQYTWYLFVCFQGWPVGIG